MLPSLIVVTGAPGSGKSTVAQPLAAHLQLSLIAKDDIKEALWDHLGAGDRERFLEYGRASYPLMLLIARLLLAAGKSAVVEGNFMPDWAADELAGLQAETPFRFIQVVCHAETFLTRYRERSFQTIATRCIGSVGRQPRSASWSVSEMVFGSTGPLGRQSSHPGHDEAR